MGAHLLGCGFFGLPASQDSLSARAAAVAADVHVAIKLAIRVATAVVVLALVACDFGVEQRWRHL